MVSSRGTTRGGGGGQDRPSLNEAISNERGYGTNSGDGRAYYRDAKNLPRPNRHNKRGSKADFKGTLDKLTGTQILEPPATGKHSSSSKYSSSTTGFDKYAKDKKSACGNASGYGSGYGSGYEMPTAAAAAAAIPTKAAAVTTRAATATTQAAMVSTRVAIASIRDGLVLSFYWDPFKVFTVSPPSVFRD